MNKCSECKRKLGILEGYRHPVEGWAKFVCNDCWYHIENSEKRYTSFILKSINKTGIGTICFVLIKSLPNQEKKTYNKLNNCSEILEIHPLLGKYDFIAKIRAENHLGLTKFIVNNIRQIEGVKSTKTRTGTFSLTGSKY